MIQQSSVLKITKRITLLFSKKRSELLFWNSLRNSLFLWFIRDLDRVIPWPWKSSVLKITKRITLQFWKKEASSFFETRFAIHFFCDLFVTSTGLFHDPEKAPLWKWFKQKNAQASLAFFLIQLFIRDLKRTEFKLFECRYFSNYLKINDYWKHH